MATGVRLTGAVGTGLPESGRRLLEGNGLAQLTQAHLSTGRRRHRNRRRPAHDLRHAFASLLIHEGRLSVVDIAAQLGHNPTVCLDTYAHVMAEQRGADAVSAEEQIFQARRRPPTPELPGALEGQLSLADLDAGPEADLMALPVRSDTTDMQQPVPSISEPGAGRSLDPNRVSIWPVECGGYGIDFTYHGATGYTDAETAEQMLQAAGLTTSFRREIDGAWTVRFGPLPRDHMRAVLDHFAW